MSTLTASTSSSLRRSVITSQSSSTRTSGPTAPHDVFPVSPLPFLVCSFYVPHEEFLKFHPGAFRRQGEVLGHGATFSVEKHVVNDIGLNMIDDLVSGERLAEKWPVVAIKRLRNQAYTSWKTFEAVERELALLKILRKAPNVVQLIGIGWEITPVNGDTRLWPILVLEYAQRGSLQDLQSKSNPLFYSLKSKLCLDVATGLNSLHLSGLVHGDLKSENVLIFGDTPHTFVAKVSDFGYVPLDYRLPTDGHGNLCPTKLIWEFGHTTIWAAPECGLPGDQLAFVARDIYSWGLLCLRVMLDGENPFQQGDERRRARTDFHTYVKRVKRRSHEELTDWAENCLGGPRIQVDVKEKMRILSRVIMACLHHNPGDRDFGAALVAWGANNIDVKRSSVAPDLMNEIWCSINTPAIRSLPARVATQFLRDLSEIDETRERMKIPLNCLPAFPAVRIILAEASKAGLVKADQEMSQQQQKLIGVPASRHLIMPPDALPNHRLSWQQHQADSVRFILAKSNKLAIMPWQMARVGHTNIRSSWQEACALGQLDVLHKLLLSERIDVNARDENGERPLLKACRAGAYDVALFLLEHGASAATVDGEEDSPLHWLCAFSQPQMSEIAGRLVRAGGRLDCQSTAKSWEWESSEISTFASGTPLLRAVSRNNLEAVSCLHRIGASTVLASKYAPYHSPLTLACSLYLGETHFGISLQNSQDSILGLLIKIMPEYEPNHYHGTFNPQRLPTFLLHNSPLQVRQLHGLRSMSKAMRSTVDLLARCGEKFSDARTGYSLLHLAIRSGMDELVEYLLAQYSESDVNLTFKSGNMFWNPPLYYAIHNNQRQCFDMLLRHGAGPRTRFQTDYIRGDSRISLDPSPLLRETPHSDPRKLRGPRSTYLHTCAGSGDGIYYASRLLNQGVRISTYDSNWESPLFLAILACDFELADFLIESGASTEILSDDRTMLGHMAEEGFMAPYAAYDYILKAQTRCGPKGPAGFMAIYGQYRTWLHVVVQFWATPRNASWAEALMDLFVKRLPMRECLDIQTDGTADTALILAIKDINVQATRKLLEWGSSPNVPNYGDGYPLDIVLNLVHTRITDNNITLKMFREKESQALKLHSVIDELTRLEEIYAMLKMYGGKRGQGIPPWKKSYEMPEWEHNKLRQRHMRLGIDLKSISKAVDATDGPVAELCNEIISDLVSQLNNKVVSSTTEIRSLVTTLGNHLLHAPECAHSSGRLFRVQQYLADLVSKFGHSLCLEFDYKRYGWRIELDELTTGLSSKNVYIISPPKVASSEIPLLPLLPEHQFSLETRIADMEKLRLHQRTRVGSGQVPISKWQPNDLPRATPPVEQKEPGSRSPNSDKRENMSAVELIRFKQLLPPEGWRIIVGPEDELAELFFKDSQPLPIGHRVMITSLMSGSHFSMTVGIKDGPARQPFLRAVPNGHYFMDSHEEMWNRRYTDATAHSTDWSQFGTCEPPKSTDTDIELFLNSVLSSRSRVSSRIPVSPVSDRSAPLKEARLSTLMSSRDASSHPAPSLLPPMMAETNITPSNASSKRTFQKRTPWSTTMSATSSTAGKGDRSLGDGTTEQISNSIMTRAAKQKESAFECDSDGGESSDDEAFLALLTFLRESQESGRERPGSSSKSLPASRTTRLSQTTRSIRSSRQAPQSEEGTQLSPELADMLRNVNLSIVVNKDDVFRGERSRGVNASTVNSFASLMASTGRATVIAVGDDVSVEERERLELEAMEKETKAKEEIEAKGVPKGKLWWEMRRG